MFLHIYLYRLKCIIRDKETMFWAFLFPILLATLFNLAFSNIPGAGDFNTISLGIVDNAEYQEKEIFRNALEAASTSEPGQEKARLFDLRFASKEAADRLLKESKIEGYVHFNDGMKLVVKESGINQTIIKGFLDDFKQTSSTIETILVNNPQAVHQGLMENVSRRKNYLTEAAVGKSAPNNIVTYFYALIGMACLYGCFLGLKEVTALQANLSAEGARVNTAPTHKLTFLLASILAAITVQLFNILFLLIYLSFILKIDFGGQLGYIALTCIIGSITGVTFGTSVAAVIKKSEGLKIGILIGSTMTMSFLAGLMYDGMKYIISTNVPILAYLNPVNLITDSLYALYYYTTYTQFFTDILLLCAFAVLFSTISYLVLRRQRYASL